MPVWSVRVYYEDTDAGGVVYHTNYLKFMERARSEWLRELGIEQFDASTQTGENNRSGVVFVVKSVLVDYLKPARFNEVLEIHSELVKLGKASMDFHQQIKRAEDILTTAIVKVACLSVRTFKPVALPDNLVKKIT